MKSEDLGTIGGRPVTQEVLDGFVSNFERIGEKLRLKQSQQVMVARLLL